MAARRAKYELQDPDAALDYVLYGYYPGMRPLRPMANRPRSLAEALRRGLVPASLVEEAERIIASYPYPRKPQTCIPARTPYNDNSFDNVVRCYEDCWE